MRRKWILISFVLFAVAGVLLAYPLVSTIINSKYHSDIETAYTAAIEDSNADELTQQRQAAAVCGDVRKNGDMKKIKPIVWAVLCLPVIYAAIAAAAAKRGISANRAL